MNTAHSTVIGKWFISQIPMVFITMIIDVMYANIIKYKRVSFQAKKAFTTWNNDFLIFEYETHQMIAINNHIAIASSLLFSAACAI